MFTPTRLMSAKNELVNVVRFHMPLRLTPPGQEVDHTNMPSLHSCSIESSSHHEIRFCDENSIYSTLERTRDLKFTCPSLHSEIIELLQPSMNLFHIYLLQKYSHRVKRSVNQLRQDILGVFHSSSVKTWMFPSVSWVCEGSRASWEVSWEVSTWICETS